MAFSTQREVSDGTLVDVRLQIEYIDREDIRIFINDIPQLVGVAWDWVSDTLLQMRTPVPAGDELLVQRATALDGVLNVFVAGASFDDPTMDENFRQMLYIAQEAREGATLEEVFNDLNLHGFKVTNLGAGTQPGDAINYQQYMDDSLGAGAARDQAVAARNQAQVFRNQAEEFANSASSSSSTAVSAASSATASATSATASRNAAATSELNAKTSENNSKTSEVNAKASEVAAAGYAAGLKLPSATGQGGRLLRQNIDETSLEYTPIIGPVSMSGGGTPRGALYEKGNTSQHQGGWWVKRADGSFEMVVTIRIAPHSLNTQAPSVVISFPFAMADVSYHLSITPRSVIGSGAQIDIGSLMMNGVYWGRALSSVSIETYAYRASVALPVECTVFIRGRWAL